MIQEIIVGILFFGAVVYLISVFRKQARAKNACSGSDCKCDPTSAKGKSELKPNREVRVS